MPVHGAGDWFLRVLRVVVNGCGLLCPHRISFQVEPVGVVDQPVQDGVGEGGSVQIEVPLLDRQLAGDEHRKGPGSGVRSFERI